MWRTAWNKATFLGFCWASFAIALGIGALAYYFVRPRLVSLSVLISNTTHLFPQLDQIVLVAAILFYLILGSGLFLITATAMTGIDLLYPHRKKSITVKVLFPIAATLSQILGVDRNKLRTSFVKVNNAMTVAQRKRIEGNRILILLPHCLQIDKCNQKITNDIHNCRQCGQCPVGRLIDLEAKYDIRLEVVNGGTLAHRKVSSFRPTGIVAVACERDLTLGIQDVYPIPVYGVINDRPYGPCLNTCVDMGLVEEGIRFFKENDTAGTPLPSSMRRHLPRSGEPGPATPDLWRLRAPFYHRLRTLWPASLVLARENRNAAGLLKHIDVSGKRVIDLGCGTGNVGSLLPDSAVYIGLDASSAMLHHAISPIQSHAAFVRADLHAPPFAPETADMVVSIGVMEYQPSADSYLKHAMGLIRPGGHLLVTASHGKLFCTLRRLLGYPLQAHTANEVTGTAEKFGGRIIAQTRSLMQYQFLFRKKF